MRNLSLINFESSQHADVEGCEVFCCNSQTLYVYDKGVVTKYEDGNRDVVCDLKANLYPVSSEDAPKALDLVYHYEKDFLCLTLCNGDIVSIDGSGSETIVGSFSDGIKASQWSPEQELIALVDGIDNVVLITKDFDLVSEVSLHSQDVGEKQIITVGWGSKETQFQGSAGKYKPNETVPIVLHERTNTVRISWRGDAEYFAVSSLNPETNLRYIRIYGKNCVLQCTSEMINGLDDCLDWRPSGNLIASTQKLSNRYTVCFFEKNGMKHGEFTLPSDFSATKVKEVLWSKDSKILAVYLHVISGGDGERTSTQKSVQFYTTGNYKWYCKYSINLDQGDEPLCMKWDYQKFNVFHLVLKKQKTVYHHKYTMNWVVNKSKCSSSNDESLVAVIDGCSVLVTAFRRGIIPPPMSTYTLNLTCQVNSVSFASEDGNVSSNDLIVQLSNGSIQMYQYKLQNGIPEVGHKYVGTINLLNSSSDMYYNCTGIHSKKLLVAKAKCNEPISVPSLCVLNLQEFDTNIKYQMSEIPLASSPAIIKSTNCHTVMYDNDGLYHSFNGTDLTRLPYPVNRSVVEVEVIEKSDGTLLVCYLDNSHKFYVNDKLIFNNVLSFHVHDTFMLLTNMKHELISINYEVDNLLNVDASSEVFRRNVERGSRLVTSVIKDSKVVLQMPRGNLECIQPRALSLYTVGKYLDSLNYLEAFNLMRKQRINLNLIYDHDPELFSKNVTAFIEQIQDPQWISLFISDVTEEDVTRTMYAVAYKHRNSNRIGENSKIDVFCDLMESTLTKGVNPDKYVLPVLTCNIKRNKIEFLERALLTLKSLKERENNGEKLEVSFNDAFRYILYLIDVDELYKIALGMYDFDLVLIVAGKSQKDPKEYLPFLNDLKQLATHYQRYTIDKYLKRYEKALTHIIQCDDEAAVSECINFVKAHKLYRSALKLLDRNTDMYKTVCSCYGDELMKSNSFEEAGIMFANAAMYKNAVTAYRRSGNWYEAINCARLEGLTGPDLKSLYLDLASDLHASKQYTTAGTVYLDYLKDVGLCLRSLTEGKHFAEAYRICQLHESGHLVDEIIVPSVHRHASAVLLHVSDNLETFVRQRDRLQVVREKKLDLADVTRSGEYDGESDAFSETSTVITRSNASSRLTNRTYRSAKNKRKQERKLLSLKEGSRYEDLALVTSLHNLATNSVSLAPEIYEINKFLVKINEVDLAAQLQSEFDKLLRTVAESKSQIWTSDLLSPNKQSFGPDATANEIASVYGQSESTNQVLLDPKYAIPPEIQSTIKWKLDILNSVK